MELDYDVVPLERLIKDLEKNDLQSKLNLFQCPKEKDLEEFLHYKAIEYDLIGYGKTYLILDKKEIENGVIKIIAFYTIGQKSIDISNLSQKKKRKVIGGRIPGRDGLKSMACFLIGQLGRSGEYTHDQLLGGTLLKECFSTIETARKIIGGNLIFLECRPKMYGLFYEKHGFKKFLEEPSEDGLFQLYRKISWDLLILSKIYTEFKFK